MTHYTRVLAFQWLCVAALAAYAVFLERLHHWKKDDPAVEPCKAGEVETNALQSRKASHS